MPDPLVYEMHCHTPLCNHAEGEPEQYAAVALQRGLKGMVVTCHNPMPEAYGHNGRMRQDELETYLHIVERARVAYADHLDIRVGLECDFFPGYEHHVERTISDLPLHHVLGSVHCQLPIWRRQFSDVHAPLATQKRYFTLLAESAETGLFDTLAHPDLVKNSTADAWAFERLAEHVAECLDRIAMTGVAMELNTSGLLKHISEMNPTPAMLRMMRQREIPVVVGADAHVPERVAADFEQAYDLLAEAGYEEVSYFLDRRRHTLSLDAARASLRPVTPAGHGSW